MGLEDFSDYHDLENLPPEAFDPFNIDGPFDPQDTWLETAGEDDTLTAMRGWFYARYCDPVHDTPYNGKEGGYLFIHGGPYDPEDELYRRFSGVVDGDLINELVSELQQEVGDQWAPVLSVFKDEYEYDENFAIFVDKPAEPLQKLNIKQDEALSILVLKGSIVAQELAKNLVFGASISNLEMFLSETFVYWLENDEQVFKNLVMKLPELKDRKITLQEIFERHSNLKKEVKGYLQSIVWHRLNLVKQLFKFAFEIEILSCTHLEEAIIKRHHIVHRSGQDFEGNTIQISVQEIANLNQAILVFASEIQQLINDKKKC
jgi:hypothetical protein